MPSISGQIIPGRDLEHKITHAKVYIFSGKVQPFAKPNLNHGQLVYTIYDGTQKFTTLSLPVGLYTVVMEINGQMYQKKRVKDKDPSSGEVWAYIRLGDEDVDVTDLLKVYRDAFQ